MRRLRFALAGLAAVVLAIVAVALTFTSDHESRPWVIAGLAVPTGLTYVAAGLVALWRRPENATGFYLAATGYLWFVGALSESDSSWVWTSAFVLGALAFVAFVTAILAYPDGRLTRADLGLVAIGGTAAIGGNLVAALVDETPGDCSDCPVSAIALTDRQTVRDVVVVVSTLVVLAALLVLGLVLLRRWRRASAAQRRLLRLVLGSVGFSLSALVLSIGAERLSTRASELLWPFVIATFAVVPFAFLYGVLQGRLARSSAARLLMALESGDDLREAIAAALGDPSADLAYRLAGEGGWVDGDGRAIAPPVARHDRAVRAVIRDGTVVAAISYDPALDAEPELVDAVAAGAAYPLVNERLRAEARAQYSFLVTLVDTAPSLFVHIDTGGRILNQNTEATRVAGLDDEEQIRGRLFWDVFVAPDERDEIVARFEAARPDFPTAEYENTFADARGDRRTVFWRSAPVKDAGGQVTGIICAGVDITTRHEEAEAHERERAFLNAIANEAPSLLCLVDERGVVAPAATNRTFARMLEVGDDPVGGELFWERYVAPEDAEGVRAAFLRVVAGETVPERDDLWITASGARIHVAWSCTPMPAIDERRLFLVSGLDVTERKRRTAELERERDATTTVLQTIPSLVVVVQRDGTIRDRDVDNPLAAVNRAFRDVLGWRDEQLVGRDLIRFVVDDDGRAAEAIRVAGDGHPSDELESEWRCADGSTRILSWSATPVADVTGRTDGLVLVSGVDVTERRERELEDVRRREFIDAIGKASPSFLLILTTDGRIRPDGANEAFEQTFGWRSDELTGRSFVGVVTPPSDAAARMVITNAVDGGIEGEIESRWESRDGDSRIVAWSARPVTGVGGEPLVLVSGVDVTLRRLQAEELRASRARIVTAADEARRRLERDLHDGAQQRLVALSVSLRLAESKATAAKAEGVPELIAAARTELGVALEELRELARGIHPAILTDRGLGPALEALVARTPLPVTLSHPGIALPAPIEAAAYFVVAEALTNVVKYAQATQVTVQVVLAEGCVRVTVRDDGVGGAAPGKGTGLRSLADRVAALDGRLGVDSPPGDGTVIVAEIPLAGAEATLARTDTART